MSGSQAAWLYLIKWVSHWNTPPTTKTPQTGQATSSLQRPLHLSTSGRLFCFCTYPRWGLTSHYATAASRQILFILTQNKTLHNETKLVCFTSILICILSNHFRKYQQLFTFTGTRKQNLALGHDLIIDVHGSWNHQEHTFL